MNLKEYLDREGIMYKRFAERIGISQTHLRDIFSGKYLPSLTVAHQIEKCTHGTITMLSWVEDECGDAKQKKKTNKTKNNHA